MNIGTKELLIVIYFGKEKKNPKETIKIGEAVYDKVEFENAVKDLKQLNK